MAFLFDCSRELYARIWHRKDKLAFDLDVVTSGSEIPEVPSVTNWENHTNMKRLLNDCDKDLFDSISKILRHDAPGFPTYNGIAHAELLVAAELLKGADWAKPPSIYIGISRRPCHVCYRVLQEIFSRSPQSGCQPNETSGLIYVVDVPKELALAIIVKVWDQISEDATKAFESQAAYINQRGQAEPYNEYHQRTL